MIGLIALLVLAGLVAGPVFAAIKHDRIRRLLGWLAVAALVMVADEALAGVDPVLRMAGICGVLLAGMKGLVYAEWARDEKLPLLRYGVFSLLWFGMDPASFRQRKPGLSWREDVGIGLVLMFVGIMGSWLVWKMEWRQIFVMFLPMSLGFHFGGLRLLKGGLRLAGFPVRTLFPNVLKAQGVGDFWSRRWNVGYSQMMQRLVGRPVANLAGDGAGVMAVFIGSGLLHELAITLPVRSGFGLPTLFFTIHGLLTLIEKKSGRQLGKVPTLLLVVVPLGLLFPPDFQDQVIAPFLGVFDRISHVWDPP